MLTDTETILGRARGAGYGVGAFNIYNLEGAVAVIRGAEKQQSPVILQFLPSALELGGEPLVAMCLALARRAAVPVAVHLDHCPRPEVLKAVLGYGVNSVMADGSGLPLDDNIRFCREIVHYAALQGSSVEGELGKLSGEEDGLAVAEREAKMTDPQEAAEFVAATGVQALAVCIGNVHGRYRRPPQLDFARLAAIAERVSLPLVLHGASGLPTAMIHQAIALGVSKFNVNTEVRTAGMTALKTAFANNPDLELVEAMQLTMAAMQHQVEEKIAVFCSANKA